MQQFLDITAALADENRARALMALRRGELCQCQITELLGLAPSTVSKHLSLLKIAGLVESRKQGRWMFFRLPDDQTAPPEVLAAIHWAAVALSRQRQIVEDTRRLKQILNEDPEELCKRQCARRNCCTTPAPRASRARSLSAGASSH
jgi:DNA-binding transcriptional ArsR family regulator